MTKWKLELCGDCPRKLMVVFFLTHYGLCKKCPETARDKVEYLQNLTTYIKNYECIGFFFKKIGLRGMGNKTW